MNSNLETLFADDEELPLNQNDFLMPQHAFRMLVCGSSGTGKTTIIFDAIVEGKLKFDCLYIYARAIDEPKYKKLARHMATVAEALNIDVNEILKVGASGQDIVKVDDLDPNKQNLVIFDDWISDKRTMDTIITEHFIRGRKRNASYVFITQSYFTVPKTIRLNCDYFILFKVGLNREKRTLCSELGGTMEYVDFKRLFEEATEKHKFDWIFIDKKTDDEELRFRKGFNKPMKLRPVED